MPRALPVACALAVGLVTAARAQTIETPKWMEGTRVYIVGRVTSAPKNILGVAHEHKMQVAVGPRKTDYTLHLKDAKIFNDAGREMAVSDLKSDWWVRATGTVMDDPRRIKVDKLEVLAPNHRDFENSSIFRKGFGQGYVMEAPESAAALPRGLSQDTPVVVVGEITSQPRNAGIVVESKMQVGVGPGKTAYTLHIADAEMLGLHGQTIHKSHLKDKMWVRAEGKVMDDPRRIKVSRLQVIGDEKKGVKESAFFRPGLDQGYVMAVAGSRQVFPETPASRYSATPVTLVGKITDDTGPFNATRKITVRSGGNDWTLRVVDGATVLDDANNKMSVHDLKNGEWVRVTGWQTGDLRLRAFRVQALRPSETFEKSSFYREESPNGYYERIESVREPFQRTTYSGTVTAVNTDFGYVILRDSDGKLHRVYTDLADITRDGKLIDADGIRTGDTISVNGYFPEMPPD